LQSSDIQTVQSNRTNLLTEEENGSRLYCTDTLWP